MTQPPPSPPPSSGPPAQPVDLVVLAGGRGSRLGGRDKGALEIGGRTLLGRLLTDVDLGGGVVVVQPGGLPTDLPGADALQERLVRTLEDPPDGGPVAGIAAGLQALAQLPVPAGRHTWVAVAAVDQPAAAQALAALAQQLPDVPEEIDAVSQVDATGHRQWLLALYRRSALERELSRLSDARHTSVRRLVSGLTWHEVEQGAEHVGDVDTWEDVDTWARRVATDDLGGSC